MFVIQSRKQVKSKDETKKGKNKKKEGAVLYYCVTTQTFVAVIVVLDFVC